MKITKPKHLIFLLLSITLFLLFIGIVVTQIVTNSGMPSLYKLENPEQELSTQIYSSDGVLLGTFSYEERRIPVTYDSIPENLKEALIASEDRKFYKHWGADPDRILKAIVKKILFGQSAGASTITQQVARNLFLDQSPTLTRKIREVITAMKIEQIYTKEQILEMYCNTVHFGRGCFGIGTASKAYFNKKPMELNLSECAMLIGILPAPARYNPYNNYETAVNRRNIVLKTMEEMNFISSSEYSSEISKPIEVAYLDDKNTPRRKIGDNIAPHFIEILRQNLSQGEFSSKYNIYTDGLMIYSTIDSRIQKYAIETVENHLSKLQANFNRTYNIENHPYTFTQVLNKAISKHPLFIAAQTQSERKSIANKLRQDYRFIDSIKNIATTIQCGMVVLNAKTGAVLALIGASPKAMRDNPEADYSLNHVTQIRRQPGSAMKPFVYASTLNNGYLPEHAVECGPFSYKLSDGTFWSPSGDGDCAPGETRSLISALQWSVNTVAARLITSATNPDEVVYIARKAGIESQLSPYPALALGAGGDVTPLELTSAYQIFVNNGLHSKPFFYEYIENKRGGIIDERSTKNKNISDALSPEIANQMIYMMEGVIANGTGSIVKKYFNGVDCAGKTGTTNDAADAWFIGYTPEIICGIWVGFDDKRITFTSLGGEGYGGHAAAPMWGMLMQKIYSDRNLKFKQKVFDYKRHQPYENGKLYPTTKDQGTFTKPNEEHKDNETYME